MIIVIIEKIKMLTNNDNAYKHWINVKEAVSSLLNIIWQNMYTNIN